ncbi:predicted protein [Sclerotinia sclerotiorum 1980 UF-70]|uniref:Uncharacterized protein n=1 Tax=Sclerotinia sclerotiorum (strain ATCC 18683 / 1980 / Ss-1) TaxID=665079 RepID=A7EJZ2_SCLS1|nr:predicted protein [Sclerotinia sclerotiorum 1980 UF-70]EDO03158.1 predicted protein [Sclerotinia sclerotiorum 1980 UF-70]
MICALEIDARVVLCNECLMTGFIFDYDSRMYTIEPDEEGTIIDDLQNLKLEKHLSGFGGSSGLVWLVARSYFNSVH